ncbi:MAG: TfoX/Sxy family protein [Polyangiaceae bacterium]|nr:TfoX/Sxy family protein [Polyangiaceae bacterium]
MASDPSLMAFVVGQLGPRATSRAMFGEFGVYLDGVLIGLFCDDRLYLKPTEAGAALLGDHERAPPYPGAKPAMVVAEDSWDDRALMAGLADATARELRAKAPARPSRSRAAKPRRRG